MRDREPTIRVGIMTGCREIGGCFHGLFLSSSGEELRGDFRCSITGGRITFATGAGVQTLREEDFRCRPQGLSLIHI